MAPGESRCGGGRRAVLAARAWNVIQFNLINGAGLGSTRCSVQRVDRECNLIQINKMDCVCALGLAALVQHISTKNSESILQFCGSYVAYQNLNDLTCK